MNDCLVTKIKGTVVSDKLIPKLGCMYIEVKEVANPNNETQYFNVPGQHTIIGDGYFTDNTLTENYGKTISGSTYVSNGNYIIEIPNKYVIAYISGGASILLHLKDLEFNNVLTNIGGINLEGDIKYLGKPTFNSISDYTNLSQCYGDIAHLGNTALNTLGRLYAAKGNIYGTIENFVANAVAIGRNTGSVQVRWPKDLENVTFEGISLKDRTYSDPTKLASGVRISWDGINNITVDTLS
jgi:hypothetical protein